ncbi:hypothetical protein T05_10514 [Trichinella murrelli]|uniref:MULE transposase domain-containing protein n=2 Tax=Trichinella murrelli TaxID=144512 RepID=A0A0V0TH71_9BILA|nr:hypothetical protein T05_10514 [Trichinella murrelli]
MLMALAFLPVHLAPAGFEIINVGKSGQLEALYQYFQQEWLPATKIKLWNVHGVSMRTNNHLEDEQGKTKTVVRQIDDGYTHGRGSSYLNHFLFCSSFSQWLIFLCCLVPNRGGSMALVFEGRLYKLKRANRRNVGGVQRYALNDKKGCKGAVWTDLEVTAVINRKDHVETCREDEHLAYKLEKKALLKKRSADEMKPIPAIYDEEASAASAEPSTSGHFPLFKRVRSTMYKHRAKRFPRLPEHRHDLVIPEQFKTTKSGEDFLLCQSNSRHILVFATGTNIRLLAACRTWGMDGTFKIVPQWYQQLFTIHAFVAGKLVPAVYCLCTGKDIATYGYIFQALIDKAAVLEVDLNPDTIICDFETALIPAIRGYFPNTRVQGCYFHFCLMDTLIQQVLSGNVTVGDLRRLNRVYYAQKQRQVAQYTGEYTNVRRTLKQFLEALMYITPEPI